MTLKDPASRPTAIEALEQFQSLSASYGGFRSRWRLKLFDDESLAKGVFYDALAFARDGFYLVRATKKSIMSSLRWSLSPKSQPPS